MWRINYILQCSFALMMGIINELCDFWSCIRFHKLPACIKLDYYDGYDPDEDPYEIQRRADWDNYNKQQEAQIQRWREENPGEDPFVEYPFSVE